MSHPHLPLPDSYEGLFLQAQAMVRAGDLVAALALYRRLVDRMARLTEPMLARRPVLRDLQAQARLEFAELLRHEGRYSEALEVKKPLLELRPDQAARWRRELAVLRVAKGDVEAGLAELQALAAADPADWQGWFTYALEARLEGRLTESLPTLDKALAAAGQVKPEDQAIIQYERFLLLKELGRLDEAIAAWEAAVRLEPRVAVTVREVYTALTETGRYTEALRYVEKDSNRLQTGFQRGLIAQRTGNPLQARQEWQAVAALDPKEFQEGYDCWAEAALRLGDPEPVLEQLPKLLSLAPSPRLLVLSGIAWAMRGDGERASKVFQQAINLRRHERPPRQKLDGDDWQLLDSLTRDDKIKSPLKAYFAVVERLWT